MELVKNLKDFIFYCRLISLEESGRETIGTGCFIVSHLEEGIRDLFDCKWFVQRKDGLHRIKTDPINNIPTGSGGLK